MKRLWLVALALAFAAALMLAGCGGGGEQGGNQGESAGTAKDTGVFSMTIHDGWTAYDVKDVFSDGGIIDPTVLQIGKGTSAEADLLTYPYLQVKYYEPATTMYKDVQGWYDNVAELEPITIGTRTWSGFNGDSAGYRWTILFSGEPGEPQFQVSLTSGIQEGMTASIEDADVLEMIASISADADKNAPADEKQ